MATKQTEKQKIESMNLLELAMNIAANTKNCEEINPAYTPAKKYVNALSQRLKLTPMEALFLAVFVDQSSDRRIRYRDLADHFDLSTLAVIIQGDIIDGMVAKEIVVKRTDSDGDVTFRVNPKLINCLRRGTLPEKTPKTDLEPYEFFDAVSHLLNLFCNSEVEEDDLFLQLHEYLDGNQHLSMCKQINEFKLCDTDLLLFFVMTKIFVQNNDDRICRADIEDFFSRRDLRNHSVRLEAGVHILNTLHLVEHSCEEGRVNPLHWKLTDYAKRDVYAELKLAVATENRSDLTHCEDIAEKALFYPSEVEKQVSELTKLLEEERLKRVMERLEKKGMRKGLPILFWGAPGTGKTETCLQLSRMTGRDIMMVDIPSIRSKWVGETEQNIKAVFERYRKVAHDNEKAPILLFNEADALFTKRNEGATHSVDKMENAMANIILQEMENLEGILIATTNLTGSLDPAFERRFLYKVQFEKPTANERQHIWKAMLPELTDEQALRLAEQFDFSGGEIENIARKHAISSILADEDAPSIEAIEESCRHEKLSKQKGSRIGFAC